MNSNLTYCTFFSGLIASSRRPLIANRYIEGNFQMQGTLPDEFQFDYSRLSLSILLADHFAPGAYLMGRRKNWHNKLPTFVLILTVPARLIVRSLVKTRAIPKFSLFFLNA